MNQRLRSAGVLSAMSLLVAAPGDGATASYVGGTLALQLRYEMTCGQPGPGPLVVRLPSSFTISRLRVSIDGALRPARRRGPRLTISLPKPPELTCMSIAEGTLRVSVAQVRAPAGTYTISASLPRFSFVAKLRVTS